MKKLFDLFIVFNSWLDTLEQKHPNIVGCLGAIALLAFYVLILAAVEKYGVN